MTSKEEIYRGCQTEEEERLIHESYHDLYQKCEKINNHEKYFKISEFRSHLLPHFREDEQLFEQITTMADLTGRIEIPLDNKKMRCGTGFVQKIRREIGQNCPDKECPDNGRCHKWAVVTVTTVYHVIKNKKEKQKDESKEKYARVHFADLAVVKLFPGQADGADDTGVKILKGFKVVDSDKEINEFDWCALECVSHDDDVISEMEISIKQHEDSQTKTYEKYKHQQRKLIVIVGYPHGGPKRLSFHEPGVLTQRKLKEVRAYQEWCCYEYTAATCAGSSGSPVFILGQPLCGFGYWFGHPHHHSAWCNVHQVSKSSIGVDHYDVSNGVEKRETGIHETDGLETGGADSTEMIDDVE